MPILYAEDKIDEAARHFASLDRELAALQRQACAPRLSQAQRKDLRERIDRARALRDRAQRDLVELVELSGMEPEEMGTA